MFKMEQVRVAWINKYMSEVQIKHPSTIDFMHYDPEEKFFDNTNQVLAKRKVLSRRFLIEVALMCAIPLPNFDMYITLEDSDTDSVNIKYTYLLSDLILAVMVLRLVFMFRAIMKFNIYNRPYAMRLFKTYDHETSPFFTVKALLSIKPEKTCLILFGFTSLVFAYWVRIFEIPFMRKVGSPNFDQYPKALWFTIITLFTVGYGDYYPNTVLAKFITIILAFWGSVLLAIVVVSISNIFSIEGKKKMAL